MTNRTEAIQAVLAALKTVVEPEALAQIQAQPDGDLFSIGLDSLRSFSVLDELADQGIEVDFGEFTRQPTLNFLVETYLQEAAD